MCGKCWASGKSGLTPFLIVIFRNRTVDVDPLFEKIPLACHGVRTAPGSLVLAAFGGSSLLFLVSFNSLVLVRDIDSCGVVLGVLRVGQ